MTKRMIDQTRRITTCELHTDECLLDECLFCRIEALQAQIDMLMLKYCPQEMTQEQKDHWAKYQVPVEDSETK